MLTKLLKISLPVLFSLLLFVLFIFPSSVKAQPPEGKVPENAIVVEPVNGITVGPGRKLWVFTFPARGGKKGPPDRGGDGPVCPAPCVDGDLESDDHSLLGFKTPGSLAVNINSSSFPSGVDATGAIVNSFTTWNNANSALGLSVNPSGGAKGPAADGNHTVGWVRIVPKNILAATWIWTVDNIVTDVDIFFNLFHKWEIIECGDSEFDVEAICTHEVGHLIGLGHFSDDCKMATMYPSAPKGEIKKRSLTLGDIAGAVLVTP